jgi:hypothetical protein
VSSYSQAVFQANCYPDYYIFIDPTDRNKIKAKNVRTRRVQFTHRSHADVVLQACCDALSAGGTVLLGVGTFNIYLQVYTPNAVNIIGSGKGRTILKRQISTSTQTLFFDASNIKIEGLTIDGNYPTNTSASFAEIVTTGNNVLINYIEVKAFNAIGIENSGIATISNCTITGVSVANIAYFGIYSGSGVVTKIIGCNITNCAYNAIFTGGKTTVENCYFAGNAIATGGQVDVGGGSLSTSFINNVFEPGAAGASGIEFGADGDCIIIGNKIRGQAAWGIVSNVSPNNISATIKGNIIKNCIEGGIVLLGTNQTNFIIEGNICFDDLGTHVQKYGISVEVGADNYIVTNNICYNNTVTNIYNPAGTGATKIVVNNIS